MKLKNTCTANSFPVCIPKKTLAKSHFQYQLTISKTELEYSVLNDDILCRRIKLDAAVHLSA